MKNDLAIFEGHQIRQSVTNCHRLMTVFSRIHQLVTDCYQSKMVESQLVTNCNQLKLPAADGKDFFAGVATGKTAVAPAARKS
jgi:hypothetical protein